MSNNPAMLPMVRFYSDSKDDRIQRYLNSDPIIITPSEMSDDLKKFQSKSRLTRGDNAAK